MSTQVQFPNLGISVNVNPVAFRLGNFEVYWYGILIGIGFMLAVLYGFSSCKKMNINKDHLFDTIIGGLIGGVVGARLYYVAFYPGTKYIDNPMEIFAIHEGGLGIYGGIIGGLLCGALIAKWRKMHVFAVLDVASIGFLIGQCIGRWGNFINQEAFGRATELPWGMYSPITAQEVAGFVHPCFLYESLLCALGFVVLHVFTRYLRQYDGQTFLLYIAWYGVSRFFIEGVRTDSLLLPGVDLRVSQVVAAASVCAAVVLLVLGFVFRNKLTLSGCGSRKAMERNGVEIEVSKAAPEIDETAESTLFSGMSTEEVEQQMAVRTRKLKKADDAEDVAPEEEAAEETAESAEEGEENGTEN
ncbi:MAG: prolipoprotein diacylglyceryl transferase [Clostridia bacterium]|nr:prolipoprotein diacylglyceryl transferase [Clostridia bacterium]